MSRGALLACTLIFSTVQVGLGAEPRVREVGPVRVTTTLTPDEPTIGDEIQFEINVEAEAAVEVLMPEFGEALDRYTILDFVPSRRIEDDGRRVFTQRYTLQPYQSGEQSIPPILVEFVDHRPGHPPTPEDLDAYEILTDRIDFSVKSVLPNEAADELKPPLGELKLVAESEVRRWYWWLAATLAAAIVVGAAFVWLRWRKKVSRRNAYEIAKQRLDQLLLQPEPTTAPEVERFFVSISAIVRKYLEDRFELRAPELTTEEFLELAGSAGDLSRDHQGLLREFLRQADLVKFAAMTASRDEIQHSVDLAIRFLEDTREHAPDVEVDAADEAAVSPGRPDSATAKERAGV